MTNPTRLEPKSILRHSQFSKQRLILAPKFGKQSTGEQIWMLLPGDDDNGTI